MPIVPSAAASRVGSPVALRLDQPSPGITTFVHDASGGAISANVTVYRSGNEYFSRKQLDRVVYEDISVQIGTSMPAGLFDWIATSWGAKPSARDGAVLRADAAFTVRSERRFRNAYIAETSFPALDAASKAPGRLTVRVVPSLIEPDTDPGEKLQSTIGQKLSKLWLTSNFELAISGLDCTRVSRIEPFSIRRALEMPQTGRSAPNLQPGAIDFPNLRIVLAASSVASWHAWHQSFVVDGKNGDLDQRSGAIALLAPNFDELARIELAGLGIFRLSTDPPETAGAALVSQVTADLYCERMILKPGGAP